MTELIDLDIVLLVSKECRWCDKTLELLKTSGQIENLDIIDVKSQEGGPMTELYGIHVVPSFISRKSMTKTTGYKDSITSLIKALLPENSEPIKPQEPIEPSVIFIDAVCPVCYGEITKAIVRSCKHAFCIECNKKLQKCPKCNSVKDVFS